MTPIERARDAAATYLASRGYDDEARRAASGEGDDFAEVRIALALIAQEERITRRRGAAMAWHRD
ncbi:hypothetical protein [Sphingomonas colocasiae]|uniref:Uncharacterized protein n=1 Tax=Sphingomonas colocasiae TaxID=1848973 RepID=A0ABS7PQV5_9SPHN|nr:hypothetical protein [Sphingomonas colocasiae]MBY8823722.1 hypothetical protein [Sphingomonas colocasiae]